MECNKHSATIRRQPTFSYRQVVARGASACLSADPRRTVGIGAVHAMRRERPYGRTWTSKQHAAHSARTPSIDHRVITQRTDRARYLYSTPDWLIFLNDSREEGATFSNLLEISYSRRDRNNEDMIWESNVYNNFDKQKKKKKMIAYEFWII